MNDKIRLRNLLLSGMVLLSLGGWLLHLRIHPVSVSSANYVPFFTGIFSIVILPFMFCFRQTIAYAYVLNGMIVIIGTITMAHYSLANMPSEITVSSFFLKTLFADIAILWSKFVFGKALFDLEHYKPDGNSAISGRFFRYPNMGFWWAHLASMSAVFAAGHLFWK